MNALVVYYTKFGNTKLVADAIAPYSSMRGQSIQTKLVECAA